MNSRSPSKLMLKRIVRLGVGALMPEGYNSAARETARLKGKLAGTKHSREDEDTIAPQQTSDAEGESRTVAIKKRPKHDPFDVVHGKKKKKEKDVDHKDGNPQPANPDIIQTTISPEESANQYPDGPEPNSPTLSTSKKKKNRKKLKVENGADDVKACEAGAFPALLLDGPSNVLNPPPTTPRSTGESALSQQIWLYYS